MLFFEDVIVQNFKHGKIVCGDHCLCERTRTATYLVLCDGVGSGIYAHIAAQTFGARLMELFVQDVPFRKAFEDVANCMQAARTEEVPYAAFSAIKVTADGNYTVLTYEGPEPWLIVNGHTKVLTPVMHPIESGEIAQCSGTLHVGDMLLVSSDGLTQAGMNEGYTYGIESTGIADYLNRINEMDGILAAQGPRAMMQNVVDWSATLTRGIHLDDTSLAMILCREGRDLVIASGPPESKDRDHDFTERLMRGDSTKIICGGTTSDIIARELGKEVITVNSEVTSLFGNAGFNDPPESVIEGVDMVTEGAIMLNQTYNLLAEDPRTYGDANVVERLCRHMLNHDRITFIMGHSFNEAHDDATFRRFGIKPRAEIISLIADRLREMKKQVDIELF